MRNPNGVGAIRESPLRARIAVAFAILILAALFVASGARPRNRAAGTT